MGITNKEKAYVIQSDDAWLGCLVVDWEARSLEVMGVGGYPDAELSLEELKELCTGKGRASTDTFHPFVVWLSNADGQPQLEFYDLERIEHEIEEGKS